MRGMIGRRSLTVVHPRVRIPVFLQSGAFRGSGHTLVPHTLATYSEQLEQTLDACTWGTPGTQSRHALGGCTSGAHSDHTLEM